MQYHDGGGDITTQQWRDEIFALSHAALVADAIPAIDCALMVHLLSEHAMRLIEDALKRAAVDFAALEMMTETNSYFEQWRAAGNGVLDKRIMALFN